MIVTAFSAAGYNKSTHSILKPTVTQHLVNTAQASCRHCHLRASSLAAFSWVSGQDKRFNEKQSACAVSNTAQGVIQRAGFKSGFSKKNNVMK
jgi:hypothetical protein